MYRGPEDYDYTDQPITLVFGSLCDGGVSASLRLKPRFVRPCPPVAFQKTQTSFNVDTTSYAGQFQRFFSWWWWCMHVWVVVHACLAGLHSI